MRLFPPRLNGSATWLPDVGGENWFELEPGDGAFLPEGTVHQYFNLSGAPARMLFTVAPTYLPHGRDVGTG